MSTDLRRTVRCSRCSKDVPFSQVRYLPDGQRMACAQCLGIVQQEREVQKKREGETYDYQCVRCHYQFSRSALRPPRICPSCASHELVRFQKKTLTGERMLRLADDPRFDRLDAR